MEQLNFKLRTGETFIPLIQLLKVMNVVESGSEAQTVVAKGLVLRNGAVELRKCAKLTSGDVITFGQFEITVL